MKYAIFKEANSSNDDKNISKLISYFHFLLSVFSKSRKWLRTFFTAFKASMWLDIGTTWCNFAVENILPPKIYYPSLLPNAWG